MDRVFGSGFWGGGSCVSREAYMHSKFGMITKGNGSHMYVDAMRLSETSPDKFWRNQAEVNPCQNVFGSRRPRETNPMRVCWCGETERNEPNKNQAEWN